MPAAGWSFPGFNDAHVHLIMGAEELVGVDLRPSRDEGDMAGRRALRARPCRQASGSPAATGTTRRGRAKALPTRDADRCGDAGPSRVRQAAGRAHGAGELAGHDAGGRHRRRARSGGGTIVRDAQRRGSPGFQGRRDGPRDAGDPGRHARQPSWRRTRAALKHAAALGVTTIQDMTASAAELDAYQDAARAGELTARISSIQNYDAAGLASAARAPGTATTGCASAGGSSSPTARWAPARRRSSSPMPTTRARAGSSSTTGAAGAADRRGRRRRLPARRPRDRRPRQHARARHLRAAARSRAARGRGWRPRIEHAQVVRPEDIARFKPLGVIASIQPSHCIDDMRWAEARIGRARCAQAYNFRSFVDAGVHGRVRDRLVRRAARPDARPLRRGHPPVPGRHAGRRLVPGAADHARAGGRVLHPRLGLRRVRRGSEGQAQAGLSRRPRRALARHLRGPAARDPRHHGRC